MVERLNSLWIGERLGYIERLCLLSALSVGHEFTLFSYTPRALKNVPAGVAVEDARQIMPEEKLLRYSDTGAVQLGANLFRYALLSKGVGYWVDMDFCFLKRLDFSSPYVFGWEHENWINNAILRAPADAPIVNDLMEIPATNRCPPWFGPKRTLFYYWNRIRRGDVKVQDLPWGTYSAGMVTYLVKKHRLLDAVQPPDVFYPLRWKDASSIFTQPAEFTEKVITDRTVAVHLWYSRLVDFVGAPPPSGSYIAKICAAYGITF